MPEHTQIDDVDLQDHRTTVPIPHNMPCLDESDSQAVYDTVLSGWVAYGEKSQELERRMSRLILGTDDGCVVCSSGTSALYLALYALGVGNGDEIILPSYMCTAGLNAVMMIGAEPVIADINKDNLSFTTDEVRRYVTGRTKAIIVVHTYGIPCELGSIRQQGIPIIEDCCQAFGSSFADGQPVGSKGDLATFSFYATKFVTGGYGGAVVAKKREDVEILRDYIDFDCPKQYKPRFNFQLSDIQAALVLSQLDRLDWFLERRKQIGERYCEVINHDDRLRYAFRNDAFNYFRFLVNFPSEDELSRCKRYLTDAGISSIVPLENYELLHNYLGLDRSLYPVAEEVSRIILSLPIYPCLSDQDVEYIEKALAKWDFR